MRILFFVSSLNAGGAERVACTLANAWVQRGDQVTLVATHLQSRECFYDLDHRVNQVWLVRKLGRFGRRYAAPFAKWLTIRRLVKTIQPDVAVSFLTNVNVNVLIATMGLTTPVVVCERTNPAYSHSAGKVLRVLRRLLYRHAASVVMQTQASVQPFKALVPSVRHVQVVPNPLPDGLTALNESDRAQYPRHEVVAMGRLVPSKQFDVLIQVFAGLAADYPQWDLTIWGDGPQRDTLARIIHDARLSDRIRLAGRTSQPWDALRRADIFAMTSAVEGFPNVLLEAMALGLPCVVNDCPSGPAELSSNGQYALLVPLGDSEAFSQALTRLMTSSAYRHELGAQAAVSVQQRYALPVVLAQWDAVLDQARRRTP